MSRDRLSPPAGGAAQKESFQERVWETGGPRYGVGEGRELVVDVAIVGNESVKEEKVRSHLQTRKDREFDSEIVQADVRRLLTTGLFRDVRTFTRPAPGGVAVTFEVVEQPTIRHLKFIGNDSVTDKTLSRNADLKVGEPMSLYAIEEARRKIEEFYHGKGYAKASATIVEGDKPHDRGATFLINEGELQRIFRVAFIGNQFVSGERLKTQIQSKPGILWYFLRGKADRRKIDEDVDRLTNYYRTFGYFQARVGRELTFDESGRWLTLTFVIDEGPRYRVRNVSVTGNQRIPSQDLLDQLALKSGDYFHLGKMNQDERTLSDVYGSQGYVFAKIDPNIRFDEKPGQLDLAYKIEEGDQFRVGKINVHISGEYPHTRQNVVLNRVSLRPGEIIDIREVRKSERRLKASQLFENDPSHGIEPRIVIRPPGLGDEAEIASEPSRPRSPNSTYRGQSPDGARRGLGAREANLDVYFFPPGTPER